MKTLLSILILVVISGLYGCSGGEATPPETKKEEVKLDMSPEQKTELDNKMKNLDLSKLKK